ncbi:hypothetical protein D3C78_1683890 [compost metagenome]
MQACSLKFCTAMERPAPIRLWPRCCSSAFIGTTRKPPSPPSRIRKGTAIQMVSMKFMQITSTPMAMPSGITRVAVSSFMYVEAATAPTAVPMATTPTSDEACVVL